MSLSKTNLFSESFNILKTFIENNISDPRNRYKSNWIHASMPEINNKGFNGYPFVLVQLDINEDEKSFGDNSQKNFRALISVYSDQATEIDTISDSIYSNLTDSDLSEFKAIELTSSPLNWNMDLKGKKILWRRISLLARSRIW